MALRKAGGRRGIHFVSGALDPACQSHACHASHVHNLPPSWLTQGAPSQHRSSVAAAALPISSSHSLARQVLHAPALLVALRPLPILWQVQQGQPTGHRGPGRRRIIASLGEVAADEVLVRPIRRRLGPRPAAAPGRQPGPRSETQALRAQQGYKRTRASGLGLSGVRPSTGSSSASSRVCNSGSRTARTWWRRAPSSTFLNWL